MHLDRPPAIGFDFQHVNAVLAESAGRPFRFLEIADHFADNSVLEQIIEGNRKGAVPFVEYAESNTVRPSHSHVFFTERPSSWRSRLQTKRYEVT